MFFKLEVFQQIKILRRHNGWGLPSVILKAREWLNLMKECLMEQTDPFKEYRVVINIEEQYSIWPTCKEVPLGWSDVGKIGPKQECLDYIKGVWVDMRPKSLRDAENQRMLLD